MNKAAISVFLALLAALLPAVHPGAAAQAPVDKTNLAPVSAMDSTGDLTENTFAAYPELEVNRTIGTHVYLRGLYGFCYEKHFWFSLGVSIQFPAFGMNGYYAELGYRDFLGTGLGFYLKLLNNPYFESGLGENDVMVYAAWREKESKEGFDLCAGLNFRFLNTNSLGLWNLFAYDSPVFIPSYIFRIACNWSFFGGLYLAGLEVNNTDVLSGLNALNVGFYLNQYYRLTREITLFCRMGVRPAGMLDAVAIFQQFSLAAGGELRL